MTNGLICDALNPKFVFTSSVFRDEIGTSGYVEPARIADHVDRAIEAWYATAGEACRHVGHGALDPAHLVRDTNVEIINPITGPAVVRIDLWVEHIDDSTCIYGFLCSSEDGLTAYARGERSVIHIDPRSARPEPWSKAFVASHSALLKDLPAFA